MFFRKNYFIIAILLLMINLIKADVKKDFKAKFADEFAIEFKNYSAELMETNLNSFANMTNKILAGIKLNPDTKEKFLKHLKKSQELKVQLTKGLTNETVQGVRDFATKSDADLLLLRLDQKITANKPELEILNGVLNATSALETEALKTFSERIVKKWREMYRAIPKEELQKNPKFINLNETFGKAADFYVKMIFDAQAVLELHEQIREFFEYPLYKYKGASTFG